MKLKYHESVLNLFDSEIMKFGTVETGGVLLGYFTSDSIVITKAVDAGPKAIHENFFFQADNNYVEMMIDLEYANSNGKINYIGEWHTHPQIVPEPSDVDLNSLSEIANSSGIINLMLIIGAINYSRSKFLQQSISIIKSNEGSEFYKVNPEIVYLK